MNSQRAFNPSGKTVVLAGATTSPAGIQAPSSGTLSTNQFRFYNAGAVLVHIAAGVDADTAQTNAAIPTGSGANSKLSFPLHPGAEKVMTFPKDSYFSAITPSSTASVYVTPGEGL